MGSSHSSPVAVSRRRSPSTLSSPRTSATSVFQRTSILGLSMARCCMILRATELCRAGGAASTSVAKRVRKVASSSAVSPPPTTATFLPRKKKPSQVAQALTAPAAQPRLAVQAQPQRATPRGDDDRIGGVLDAAGPQPERPLAEVDPLQVHVHEARPEALGLLPACVPSAPVPGCLPGSPGSSRRRW